MDRRRFVLTSLVGALATPLTAGAQPAKKMWRVGYLGDAPRAERLTINLEPFRDGLRELGYVEGQNIIIEERWTEGRGERLADLATELVRLKVDVIVTHGVRATRAAQKATTTIAIVGAVMPDPVETGLVASLARPGGNTTGLSDQVAELAEKEIQILKEALPSARRVAILWHEGNPGAKLTFEQRAEPHRRSVSPPKPSASPSQVSSRPRSRAPPETDRTR
jgi:putative ABC transport system substrate-binding protein